MTELKPCPFCGEKEGAPATTELLVGKVAYNILCQNCHALGSPKLNISEAISAWNSRYRCTDRHECKKSGEIARQPAVKEETLSSTPQVAGQADCIPSAVEHPAKLPRELWVDISKLGLWYTDELFLSDSKPCEFDERQGNWIHFREVME